jgi:hypothetical protein
MPRRLCTALLASLLLLATACGTTDGDAEAGDKATTTTAKKTSDDGTSTTGKDGEGDGSNPEFCAAAAELNSLFDDVAEDDYQGVIDAIDAAEEAFNAYVETIPEDLKDEAQLLVESLKTLAADVDGFKDDPDAAEKMSAAAEQMQSGEIQTAGDAVDAYEEETCPDA